MTSPLSNSSSPRMAKRRHLEEFAKSKARADKATLAKSKAKQLERLELTDIASDEPTARKGIALRCRAMVHAHVLSVLGLISRLICRAGFLEIVVIESPCFRSLEWMLNRASGRRGSWPLLIGPTIHNIVGLFSVENRTPRGNHLITSLPYPGSARGRRGGGFARSISLIVCPLSCCAALHFFGGTQEWQL